MYRKEEFFMNKKFNSIYGSHIEEFIAMKRVLGFKYETGSSILLFVDAFAVKRGETSAGITKEFVEEWSKKRLNESDRYRYVRVKLLSQFSSYLNDLGIRSYIPRHIPFPKSNFTPYIYSLDEINSIFKACDELRHEIKNTRSTLFAIPLLFRLLYATGLRISEALALCDNDVNLNDNYLHVKDCKNGKDRIIPISDSLSSVCKEYLEFRAQLPERKLKSGYFFVKTDGNRISSMMPIAIRFRRCLKKAGIMYKGRQNGPRIHDLRHTFAVHSLIPWLKPGLIFMFHCQFCLPTWDINLWNQRKIMFD